MMKPLAIIPARAGSKRLPGKNREMVDGKTLVEIAVNSALDSGLRFPLVVVSTDDHWFFENRDWRPPLPIWLQGRPPHLAADDTPMMDVVRTTVADARVSGYEGAGDFDSVVLLQPTSPLRDAADILTALAMLERADAVVSVVKAEEPELYMLGHAGRLRRVSTDVDGRRMVKPNGAIFAITTEALDAGKDWWTADYVYAYEMPPERSVDIDTQADLDLARQLWATR